MNRTIDIDPLKSVVIDDKELPSLESLGLHQTTEGNTLSDTTIATLGQTVDIIEEIHPPEQQGDQPKKESLRQDVEIEGHDLTITVVLLITIKW